LDCSEFGWAVSGEQRLRAWMLIAGVLNAGAGTSSSDFQHPL
jgi:hypothetical protein